MAFYSKNQVKYQQLTTKNKGSYTIYMISVNTNIIRETIQSI